MPTLKHGPRAPLRVSLSPLIPFHARRALNECENVLTSLYWCIAFLGEPRSFQDALTEWDCAKRFSTRLFNRLLNGELDGLDIETKGATALESLYDTLCIVWDAFELAGASLPNKIRKLREAPMTCLEIVELRRTLTDIGYHFGWARLLEEDTTFTDDPRAVDVGHAVILSDELSPQYSVEDAIFLREWNLTGRRCEYEEVTADTLLKERRFQHGLKGQGWPVTFLYAICKNCGHWIGTDLVVRGTLETVYRKCDTGTQEGDPISTPNLPPAVWSRPFAPAELKGFFNCDWKTVKKRIEEGHIRAKKLNTKSYRIHMEDLPRRTFGE